MNDTIFATMTSLLLIALLILAPTAGFTQTAAAGCPQLTSGAPLPIDCSRDFLDAAVLSPEPYVLAFGAAVIDIVRELAPEVMRLITFR